MGFKKNINRFLRFRDDVSVHISGTKVEICEILKIILTGYPPEIQFNAETNLIYGKFLNIKIFNDPTSTTPFTSILRKENFKNTTSFPIIPMSPTISSSWQVDHIFALLDLILILDLNLKSNLRKKKHYFKINPP